MKELLTPKAKALQSSAIEGLFSLASEAKDCVSLGVGEPDFATPYHIVDAAKAALDEGKTFYSDTRGLTKLRAEIVAYYARRFQVQYAVDEVLITIGASEAIDDFFRAVIDQGDEVIIIEPSFVCYAPDVHLAGGKAVPFGLSSDGGFHLDIAKLEQAITPRTKVLVLSFPNNPTGVVLSEKELLQVAELVQKHDLFVLSDEIYGELCYEGKMISFASLPEMKERTLTINGFSKSYAMTGWRLGYALGPKELIHKMTQIHSYATVCATIFVQFAAIEALRNGDKDIERMKEQYCFRRNFLYKELCDMGFEVEKPRGAFYMFPSVKKYGLSDTEFATRLLKEERLVVVPGSAFGAAGAGFIRLSYAYSIEDIKEALRRLKRFIDKLEGR